MVELKQLDDMTIHGDTKTIRSPTKSTPAAAVNFTGSNGKTSPDVVSAIRHWKAQLQTRP